MVDGGKLKTTKMEKAISTITNFTTSKDGITKFVNQCVNEIEAGLIDPLHMSIYLKTMEKIVEGIQAKIKASALSEAEKYGKSFDFRGAKIELTELGTKYEFKNCNDVVWDSLNKQITELTEKRKEREAMLKTVKDSMTLVDEESGETWKVHPPIKTSTSGIKITIK